MEEVYTTAELVTLLAISQPAILKKYKAEHWHSVKRQGRGGGNAWVLESMPKATQFAIKSAELARIAEQQNTLCCSSSFVTLSKAKSPCLSQPSQSGLFTSLRVTQSDNTNHISTSQDMQARGKAFILDLLREYKLTTNHKKTTAYEAFALLYNENKIEVPTWVRNKIAHISRPSLLTWEKASSLVPRYGQHRKGQGIIDSNQALREALIAEIVHFYDISSVSLYEMLVAKFGRHGVKIPTLRHVQRWVKNWKEENASALLKAQNPDKWRSHNMVSAGCASADITRINQRWELDSSPTDIMLIDGRYTLIGCIDVFTRKLVLHVEKTSNSQAVCTLLRKAILNLGIPQSVKLDNGADYTSYQVTSVLQDLEIQADYCTPFEPQQKPHIERVFKTLQHGFLTRLDGYIGHNVADRKAIESRKSFAQRISKKKGEEFIELKYNIEEFRAIVEDWCHVVYGEKVHSALKVSPNDMYASHAENVHKVENERALDILLMPLAGGKGLRTVTKKGLRIENSDFLSSELGAIVGETVCLRMDSENAGIAYVFDLNDQFICKVECPEITGVSRRELALAAKARQKVVSEEQQKEFKRIIKEQKPEENARLILEHKKELAKKAEESRQEPTIISYVTPALKEAAKAAEANEPKIYQQSEESKAVQEKLIAEYRKQEEYDPLSDLALLEGREAFKRAKHFEEKITNNQQHTLKPEEIKWLLSYQGSNEYQAMQMLYASYGVSMFGRTN